jgi:hypothetical protein
MRTVNKEFLNLTQNTEGFGSYRFLKAVNFCVTICFVEDFETKYLYDKSEGYRSGQKLKRMLEG